MKKIQTKVFLLFCHAKENVVSDCEFLELDNVPRQVRELLNRMQFKDYQLKADLVEKMTALLAQTKMSKMKRKIQKTQNAPKAQLCLKSPSNAQISEKKLQIRKLSSCSGLV